MRRSLQYLNCLPLLVLLPCSVVRGASETTNVEYFNAILNITAQEPGSKSVLDDGRYGLDSPVTEAKGIIVTPVNIQGAPDKQGCDSHIRFPVPPNTKHWIALLQRGNCTFKEKILRAASHNATAVVIYNNNSNEDTVTMTHQGTGDIVAIMISESTGREILSYVERNISVLMAIAVGSKSPAKNLSRGSLVFVSISFIVLMIISSAWLIFYFIQRIRYTSARDRNQRRLGDAAKKAIGKLTTRTVRKGDKETDPDFDHCAVCIESYKQNDIVRVLPCKHVFHKVCVDPWLSEHCTCPMCKLNILKALGIVTNVPCSDNVAFDVERLTRSQPSSRGTAPSDPVDEGSLILESLRSSAVSQLPHEGEITPRTGEINIAVTKEWFIIASFGLLSALTLCYMIIKATANLYATEYQGPVLISMVTFYNPVMLLKVCMKEMWHNLLMGGGVGTHTLPAAVPSKGAAVLRRLPGGGSLFFHRNSLSPRSLGYETELSTIEPSLDIYDENKT